MPYLSMRSIFLFGLRGFGTFLVLLLLASCGGTGGGGLIGGNAASAVTGTWWNPAEPGTHLFVEGQGDKAAATLFAYEDDGRPVWYGVVGSLRPNAAGELELVGTLQRFRGGQSARSAEPRPPTATAIGPIQIAFSGNQAVVQVPGRRFEVTKANPGAPGIGSRDAPETGILWNPAEGGRGYAVEVIQGSTRLSIYHYDEAGEPTWNLVTGQPVQGAFTAELQRYEGGQTLVGPYRPATRVPGGEPFQVRFTSACEASFIFPGMAETQVRRPLFGDLAAGGECRSRSTVRAADPKLAVAILQVAMFFLLVLVPGLSLSPGSSTPPEAFVTRMLFGSATLAWVGLILTFLVPALRNLAFFALLAWWRCGFRGIVAQLRPARELLAVQLLACVLVVSLGLLYGGYHDPFGAAAQRWFHWTPDSVMPTLALKRMLAQDLSLMWDWHVSDRPPLQSAFIQMLSPFTQRDFPHVMAGVVCQSLVIPGCYLLLRSLRVGARPAIAAVALFATSGFFLMNGFFTWPKLLSASYLAAGAACLFSRDEAGRRRVLMAGVFAAMGCLAHGGGAFAVLGMLIVALCGLARRRIPWFVLAMVLTALPWLLFTKFVDPPGDRLAKWHLAGIIKPDERGLAQTMLDSYRSRTPQQVVSDKLHNLKIQFGEAGFYRDALRTGSKAWWDHQFGTLALACFPAWLAALALLFRRSRSLLAGTGMLHVLWIVALLVTCLLMFGPALDVDSNASNAYPSLPQQSYFVPVLALLGATLAITSLPAAWRIALIVLQLGISTLPYFFPPVGVSGPLFTGRPAMATLAVAIAALAGVAWFFLRRDQPRPNGG